MHVFHVYYKPYEIVAPSTMSEEPKIDIKDLDSSHILPTSDNFIKLLSVFKIICSRILVDRVSYLKKHSKHVVKHIGHTYSDVLKRPSILVGYLMSFWGRNVMYNTYVVLFFELSRFLEQFKTLNGQARLAVFVTS